MKRLFIVAALVALAAPAYAKDYTVKMVTDTNAKKPYQFNPAQLTIRPGDTVIFTDAQDDMHDVMFDAVPKGAEMAMSPMLEKKGQSWSYTFTKPGTYEYHCHPHEALNMRGTIIVGMPSKPDEMQRSSEHHAMTAAPHAMHADMDHSQMAGMTMDGMGADKPAAPHAMEDMHDMPGMSMHGFYGQYPMTREASGTSWLPDSSPMEGIHGMTGDWMTMYHGYVNLVYDHQGGRRGGNKTFSESMAMAMAQRPLGAGTFGVRAMMSLDPLMGKNGYPLLLQTGESADGATPLIDRQHPHDLFMELAATYSLPLTSDSSVFAYIGYPGEPALGPATFMHRLSGIDNPEAPVSHHWLDSTHITFGVATLGYVWRDWKVEASAFNGREPDEQRWNFEEPRLNSGSTRLTFNPNENWSLQVSRGYLRSPEALEANVDQIRTTASATYNLPIGDDNWQTTLAWGRNENSPGNRLDAVLLEAAYRFRQNHTIFGRAEYAEKDELFEAPDPLAGTTFNVSKFSVGYVYDIPLTEHVKLGLGGLGSAYALPSRLDPAYGNDPVSYMAFARLKLD